MKVNYTNQIRVINKEKGLLMDIRYDNTKMLTHAVKTHQLKIYKEIINMDGTKEFTELPPFFAEQNDLKNKAIELIYKDRRQNKNK
tara:strand:- start:407 stop:664 length:258 start_codon:yes stop_codon:yes gene_type:complete